MTSYYYHSLLNMHIFTVGTSNVIQTTFQVCRKLHVELKCIPCLTFILGTFKRFTQTVDKISSCAYFSQYLNISSMLVQVRCKTSCQLTSSPCLDAETCMISLPTGSFSLIVTRYRALLVNTGRARSRSMKIVTVAMSKLLFG